MSEITINDAMRINTRFIWIRQELEATVWLQTVYLRRPEVFSNL